MKFLIGSIWLYFAGHAHSMSFSLNPLNHLDNTTKDEIQSFIEENRVVAARPEHCPSRSTNYSTLVAEISTIEELFLNTCLDSTRHQIDAIIAGASDIQASLSTYNQTVSEVDGDAVADTESIDGNKIATVVNGLSTILSIQNCNVKEYNKYLSRSATILSEIAKIGLLTTTGKGILISAGGYAMASILKSIDNYLTPHFDFSDADSRSAYSSLSCAFYDLRRDIELAGLFDINTSVHNDRLSTAKKHLIQVEKKLEEIEKQYIALSQELTEDKILQRNEEMKGLVEMKDHLKSILAITSLYSEETAGNRVYIMNNLAKVTECRFSGLEHHFSCS